MDVHRDAAAVIRDADRAVVMDGDLDVVAKTRQGFVDGVVHHLEHHVMQAGAVVRVADVHAGTFADSFQPLQNLDAAGIVNVIHGIRPRQY